MAALKASQLITVVGEEGSGLKGKAFQKESPGVLADSNGGRSFLNAGAQSGRGGGAGDGPPKNQLIRARRDKPKGPERKKIVTMVICEIRACFFFEMDRGSLEL